MQQAWWGNDIALKSCVLHNSSSFRSVTGLDCLSHWQHLHGLHNQL